MNWEDLEPGDSYVFLGRVGSVALGENHLRTVVSKRYLEGAVKEVLLLNHRSGETYWMEVTNRPISPEWYEVFKAEENA